MLIHKAGEMLQFHEHTTPPKSNMTGWKIPPWMKMYFLLKMVIFQPVMLVFGGVFLKEVAQPPTRCLILPAEF